MTTIYRKPFVFEANHYEEYMAGLCVESGKCSTRIVAQMTKADQIRFSIQGDVPCRMTNDFRLSLMGEDDILSDRVQYGRLPISLKGDDPTRPIVCNIFNNMTCIRFAMLSPLRIVEFYGQFVEL